MSTMYLASSRPEQNASTARRLVLEMKLDIRGNLKRLDTQNLAVIGNDFWEGHFFSGFPWNSEADLGKCFALCHGPNSPIFCGFPEHWRDQCLNGSTTNLDWTCCLPWFKGYHFHSFFRLFTSVAWPWTWDVAVSPGSIGNTSTHFGSIFQLPLCFFWGSTSQRGALHGSVTGCLPSPSH